MPMKPTLLKNKNIFWTTLEKFDIFNEFFATSEITKFKLCAVQWTYKTLGTISDMRS